MDFADRRTPAKLSAHRAPASPENGDAAPVPAVGGAPGGGAATADEEEAVAIAAAHAAAKAVAAEKEEQLKQRIVAAQNLAEVMAFETDSAMTESAWMVWMIQRAWLEDPSLEELNFSDRRLPPASEEPRVMPRLLEVLGQSRFLRRLRLARTGLFGSQVAEDLAMALARNEALELLDIEVNRFQPRDLQTVVNGLQRNTSLRELRLSHQLCEPQPDSGTLANFYAAISENRHLQKLGVDLDDIHWRDRITRHLVRNVEAQRRRRQNRRQSTDTQASSNSDGYAMENLP